MPDTIPVETRALVAHRAQGCCEYCLIREDDTFAGCEVDHIISRKHGGTDDDANLAFACFHCNRRKGSDLGSLDSMGRLVRFFNPRTDGWRDHFRFDGTRIVPLTEIGSATGRILGFNDLGRVAERWLLLRLRRYPGRQA